MFYDEFISLCNKKKISKQKACIDCGISRTAWNRWKKGSVPGGPTIQKLADYFGVTADYLLGAETEKAPTSEGERKISDDDLMFALWGDTDMGPEDLDDVKRYAEFVRVRKEKQ